MDKIEKHDAIDKFEKALLQHAPVTCPLTHVFTPGLYMRKVEIPAGTILTSKIHKTEHQFVLLKGKVSVMVDDVVQYLEAPYHGITKAGTRRVVLTHEPTIWITFHATDKNTPEEVEEEVIEKHDNKYFTEVEKRILNNKI